MCMLSHFSHVWFCDPMDYSLPGSSVLGILQARILEWVAISYSRGCSWPRSRTHVSYLSLIGRRFLNHWHHLGSPVLIVWETVRVYFSLTKKPNTFQVLVLRVKYWCLASLNFHTFSNGENIHHPGKLLSTC